MKSARVHAPTEYTRARRRGGRGVEIEKEKKMNERERVPGKKRKKIQGAKDTDQEKKKVHQGRLTRVRRKTTHVSLEKNVNCQTMPTQKLDTQTHTPLSKG